MSPEDTNAITLPDPLSTDDAYQRVVAFARHFGEPHTRLAMHAALPLGLTPEIVHLIRINFVRDADWIAEADLLLSPLCREVGGELYEMYPDVREFLLDELRFDQEFGPFRIVRIAEFLWAYAERAIKLTKSPEMLDFLRAQQWVALAYADPEDAAESLALALREGLESANRDETIRIASLTQVLATPLIAEEKVLLYAAGVEKLAAGDRSGASRIFEVVGPTDQSPRIGDVSLPSPDEVMQMLGRSLATPEAAAPLLLYPYVRCPNQIIINQKFSLFVQLLSEPPEEGIEAIHIKDTGVHEQLPEVEVVLRVSGFDVEDSNAKVLRVQRDDVSQEEFVLIPHQREEQQIQVDFYQDSQLIGTANSYVSVVEEREEREKFDVFLAHNSEDKPQVRAIANRLKERGIKIWLDEEQIPPGRSFQDEIQKVIPLVKCVAIFIGLKEFGKWQTMELRSFTRICVEEHIPLIPVLLPGVTQIPENLVFLKEYTRVDFSKNIDDVQALKNLVWGISATQSSPQQKPTELWFNGDRLQQFYKALLSAFPTTAKLKQIVRFRLDQSLDAIAGGANHSEVVYNLILWAETEGRLKELLIEEEPDDLSSDTGVDYRLLRDLLAAGNSKEADEETLAVMLKASGREQDGWLDNESIENFPWTDLRTIDQLWLKYSNGRFGFSVQKRIWQSVGGNPDATYETWLRFCDRVEWRVSGKYIELDVAYNTLSCDGHLPIMGVDDWDYKWSVLRCLFSRPNL